MAFIYDIIKIGIIDAVFIHFFTFLCSISKKNYYLCNVFSKKHRLFAQFSCRIRTSQRERRANLIIIEVCAYAQTSP